MTGLMSGSHVQHRVPLFGWVWPMQGPELRNSFPVINTKTGSGCSKYVKCFSHAPIVWCSAFWNVKLLFCNDFALLAITTTHQSILRSQVFPFYCQPRPNCVTRTWHIVCDIYISTLQVSTFEVVISFWWFWQHPLMITIPSVVLLSTIFSFIYISTFRVCQARWLSCGGELHWIDVCW